MKLYTWKYGMFGLQRFMVVSAGSVEEARLVAVHYGMADLTEKPEDWRPGGYDFESLMRPPAFETDVPGPLILDSYQ